MASDDLMAESVNESPYLGETQVPNRSDHPEPMDSSEERLAGWYIPSERFETQGGPSIVRPGRWSAGLNTRDRARRERSTDSTANSVRQAPEDPQYQSEYGRSSRHQSPIPMYQDRRSPKPTYLKLVMMMKSLGTKPFGGGVDPFAADTWLRNLEKRFNTTRCPAEYKKDIATFYLEKDAMSWWLSRERDCGDGPAAWENFKREFKRKYFPHETRDRLEIQFLELKQEGRTVRAYEAEFTRLRRYIQRGAEDEDFIIRRFIRGLKGEIRSILAAVEFHNFNEAVERAVDVEASLHPERMVNRRPIPARPRPTNQPRWPFVRGAAPIQRGRGRSARGDRTNPPNAPTCYNCGRSGHYASACSNGGRYRAAAPTNMTCYRCGERGHYATSCPRAHPTGQGPQAPAAPRPPQDTAPGRVYALGDQQAGPSRQGKGPITGTIGF